MNADLLQATSPCANQSVDEFLTTGLLVRDRSVQLPRVVPELQQVPAQKPQRELVRELQQVQAQQQVQALVQQRVQALPLVRLVHCDRCSRVHLLE